MIHSAPIDNRKILSQSVLFSQLEPEEVDRLAQSAKPKQADAKDVIFYQGDPGSQMFAITTGGVRVSVLSQDGKEIILGTLGPGDIFGEIALLDGRQRAATVTAIELSEFLVIERHDFVLVVEKYPQVAIKLLAIVTGRLRITNELIEDTLFLNLPSRLAKKLLALAKQCGEQTSQGLRIKAKFSQQERGSLVGTSGESINKQLRAWQDKGLVKVDRGYILIANPRKLALLCNGSHPAPPRTAGRASWHRC
jgi:CRP-like cAMP-binding protein